MTGVTKSAGSYFFDCRKLKAKEWTGNREMGDSSLRVS